jgi:3-oxoacyl-[acyl-carrier protein] reductase
MALIDINRDTLKNVSEKIRSIGRRVLPIPMDVAKWEEAEEMAKKVLNKYGRIDILVNNAGISPKGKEGNRLRIEDIGEQDWDRVMNVNLKGVFNCSKAVMPIMKEKHSGKIVNIGSIAGLTGGAGALASAHYCVSKAGVICLTKVLARELAEYNINVNAIAPGRIATQMAVHSSSEANEETLKQTPLGRFGKPLDIARAVLFMVSESGDYMTGETMVLDGGRVMQ